MGKSASAGKQQVNEYNLSVHFGICAELDAITAVYFGEKEGWRGDVAAQGPIPINKPDLFGGPKKEGGVRGTLHYLPGSRTQVLPNGLAAKRGLTAATSPAYRGLASAYFTGALADVDPTSNNGIAGFYWGSTPYIQSVWITGRRAPKGLDPDYAMIGNQVVASFNGYVVTIDGVTVTLVDGMTALVGGHSASLTVNIVDDSKTLVLDGLVVLVQPFVEDDDGDISSGTTVTIGENDGTIGAGGSVTLGGLTVSVSGDVVGIAMGTAAGTDANPSHIVYECLTNVTWGMGAPDSLIDKDKFEACGRTLYNEGFGLSLQWTREAPIKDFIREIQDHVQMAIYVDMDTGKLTPALFRDDYDATTLPLITPDNAVLDDFQRKLWGETVNEIVVTWTNPANEQEETVTQQDLGNITLQGATVSDSRNYYAVRNADLATRLAIRDVRQSSAPLASASALLDRTNWNLRPGSVVRMTWPEYGIENMVMRVTSIDYGKVGSPSIVVQLLEDIFSLESASFNGSASSGFVTGAMPPTPMNHVAVITAPAYFASRYLSSADAAALTYPDTLVALLAANSNPDASFYQIVGLDTLPNGDIVSEVRSTRGLLGYTTLQAALPEAATSVIPSFGLITPGTGPNVGGFVFIGGGTERSMEIAVLASVDGAGWHLSRGVLDTVPRAWPAGTPLWFYDLRNMFIDSEYHSDGEAVAYKLLTTTSLGTLAPIDAPVHGAVLTGRPYYPNRPANVKIGGVAFGTVDLSATPPTTIDITWANRNRTLEDSTVLKWTDATIAPEAGQTTSIRLTRTTDGSTITTVDGLTGTSHALPVTAFGSEFEADITVTAKRDGYESLMGIKRRVRIAPDPANPGSDPGDPTEEPDDPYVPPDDPYPDPRDPPTYCVETTAQVLLADGSTVAAGHLLPGMMLWTQHEHTLEWGAFEVEAVEIVDDEVFAAPGVPRATQYHRFRFNGDGGPWTRMYSIGVADGWSKVAKITVREAHTYVTVEADGTRVLSHNMKNIP